MRKKNENLMSNSEKYFSSREKKNDMKRLPKISPRYKIFRKLLFFLSFSPYLVSQKKPSPEKK